MTQQCRVCGEPLNDSVIDLGSAPQCESFLDASSVEDGEVHYPLHVRICATCLLVQLPQFLPPDQTFTDEYPYFSSFSSSWVEHARRYATAMTDRLGLHEGSQVVEVASNDGYLLQHFRALGIPAFGIEPTANTAAAAVDKGIETEVVFLGEESAAEIVARRGRSDLVVANNVYAHVPDLRDFTLGLAELLAPDGMLTLEYQHVGQMLENNQFDTIYHEHFQYYSLYSTQRALALGDLVVVDVEELPSHGGSLRVYAQHRHHVESARVEVADAVPALLAREAEQGLHEVAGYAGFAPAALAVKRALLTFLLGAQAEGKTVVGYGAPGKGNTMLNYCGIRPDLLAYTVDRNHHKHGMFLPGSRIPVLHPDQIALTRPDYVLVLPWNLRREISEQLEYVRDWGGKLVFAIPQLEID